MNHSPSRHHCWVALYTGVYDSDSTWRALLSYSIDWCIWITIYADSVVDLLYTLVYMNRSLSRQYRWGIHWRIYRIHWRIWITVYADIVVELLYTLVYMSDCSHYMAQVICHRLCRQRGDLYWLHWRCLRHYSMDDRVFGNITQSSFSSPCYLFYIIVNEQFVYWGE